ncbi:MAG: cell division protein FtsZ [Bacteroidia bacterium]|nr:MAG: cell division protein FtsZ [Bacteroidia bacterium]
MSLSFPAETPPPIILVMGVGGAGGNAVANMFNQGIVGVDFAVCNTDAQVLARNPVPTRLLIGQKLTRGLGCGADPQLGQKAAEESLDELRGLLGPHTQMVFLTAGLGGGTGTGALPVIARLCREQGLLTVAVVTLPFAFEGLPREKNAYLGLQQLEGAVDALVVIPNENLLRIAPKNMLQKEAFAMVDNVLYRAVRGIAEVITRPGYINLDFADIRTIMRDSGYALLGMSTQRGENRALMAIEEALSSPLLDNVDIRAARGLLINVTASSENFTIEEYRQIMDRAYEALGGLEVETNILVGQAYDEEMGDALSVTLVATGLARPASLKPRTSLNKRTQTAAPPPLEPQLPLDSQGLPASASPEAPSPAAYPLHERLREIKKDPDALQRLRSSPAIQRIPPPSMPPLSSTRIEPDQATNPLLRRNNPRLYDNAD